MTNLIDHNAYRMGRDVIDIKVAQLLRSMLAASHAMRGTPMEGHRLEYTKSMVALSFAHAEMECNFEDGKSITADDLLALLDNIERAATVIIAHTQHETPGGAVHFGQPTEHAGV